MFIASCGIDGDLKRIVKSRGEAMERTKTKIESARDKHIAWTKTSAYEPFERYAKVYSWQEQYSQAISEVNSAQSIWAEIAQILKRNREEDEDKLRLKVRQLNGRLGLALNRSKGPNKQIGVLKQLMADAAPHIQKADEQVSAMKGIVAKMAPVVDQAGTDSKEFAWNKEKDIANRFSQFEGIYTTAVEALVSAKSQNESDDSDYAIMAADLARVAQQLPELQQADIHFRKLLGELSRSYTKRLIDMKYAYMTTIGRTSWNNYYDYPTETDYKYRGREVDESAFKYLSGQSGDIASGMSWVRPQMPVRMWKQLKINPKERAPRGDDDAVFWVSSMDIDYFHRYLVIENGKATETDWEAVNEDEFADNLNNLGMDIVSKPYGLYLSEVIEEATPPGLAHVGNEKYGHWEKDSSGNSFWAFYGRYAMLNALLGGNRYYYNDWYGWNRDYRGRSPYYGRQNNGPARYGTSGSTVRSNPRYKSSTFSRRGGIKTAPADIRSAAGGARGRGPGSRGK